MTTVGVTGHQKLPAAVADYARERLSAELADKKDLQGICSLAVGADQLFAKIVLSVGGELHVVVPCERYESSFDNEAERVAYTQLMASAKSVETLDFPAPTEEAYFAAGKRVVDLSKKLVAVWDGKAAKGRGGTADVVAYANEQRRPVEVLWLEGLSR